MAKKIAARAPGQVRQSQLLTTYGPGAMVDLPNHAVIIGGLESWTGPKRTIREDRLQQKLAKMFNRPSVDLFAPPIAEQDGDAAAGVRAFRFPEWFVAQYEDRWGENKEFRSRPLVHAKRLREGQYLGPDKKKYSVLPVRFVQACPNGHISDIDWPRFVHSEDDGQVKEPCYRQLWLDERGTTGDFAEIFVRCECGKSRSLAQTSPSKERPAPLGYCRGDRPWLGSVQPEGCTTENDKSYPNRLLIRSASNAYFSQKLSVIHIPEKDAELRKAVDLVWADFLVPVESQDELKFVLKQQKVFAAIGDYTLERVWGEIQRRRHVGPEDTKSIKQAELETLLAQPHDAKGTRDFFAQAVKNLPTAGPMAKVERVVLVHKLREVTAQIGFTRFESVTPDIDGEFDLGVKRSDLALDISWLPAVENHGEGVFIAFKKAALEAWWSRRVGARYPVQERTAALVDGFDAWAKARKMKNAKSPGPKYVMLHSLAHLLITAVALECGYSASSIKERIYVSDGASGILLYTGSADADGTLGGLVEIGRHIDQHLRAALDYGRLCSNDPVCAQHRPNDKHEERFLHGAACHGCLLIAEPSCERQNQFLDRALVVPTVDEDDAAFFGGTG